MKTEQENDLLAMLGQLLVPCPHCAKARAAVIELYGVSRNVDLLADVLVGCDPALTESSKEIDHLLKVHCEHCLDTLKIPTKAALILLGVVRVYLPLVKGVYPVEIDSDDF